MPRAIIFLCPGVDTPQRDLYRIYNMLLITLNRANNIIVPRKHKNIDESGTGKYINILRKELESHGVHIDHTSIPERVVYGATKIESFAWGIFLRLNNRLSRQNVLFFEDQGMLYLSSFFSPKRFKKIIAIHDPRIFTGIVSKHNDLPRELKPASLGGNPLVELLNGMDLILAVSDYTRNFLIDNRIAAAERIELLYNPIETKGTGDVDVPGLLKKYRLESILTKKIILYVGSEKYSKNFFTLIRTLDMLDAGYAMVKIGDYYDRRNRKTHQKMIRKKRLPVFFLGKIPEADLIKFYRTSDVYLYPSLYDGFGRTPVEAQAQGLPVIAAENNIRKEVLGESCLVVKDPGNPEEWRSRIIQLEDTGLRESIIRKGYENAARFEPLKLGNRLMRILDERGFF